MNIIPGNTPAGTAAARAAYIAGLRLLADALERDENVPVPRHGNTRAYPLAFGLLHDAASGEEFASVIRALGAEDWQQETKSHTGYTWLDVSGHLAGLWIQVSASADKVCEPIEPQPVIERRCPALDAVIAEAQVRGAVSDDADDFIQDRRADLDPNADEAEDGAK